MAPPQSPPGAGAAQPPAKPPAGSPGQKAQPASTTVKVLSLVAVCVFLFALILALILFFYRRTQRRRKKRRVDALPKTATTEDKLRAAMRLPGEKSPSNSVRSPSSERIQVPEISLTVPKTGTRRRSEPESDSGFRWIDSGAVSDSGGRGSLFGKMGKSRKYSML